MALEYRPVDRDQQFLLPPDMRSWLEPGHLIWTVLDIVAAVDTSAFHAKSRRGSVGRAGFDPDMLLGLLLYGYAVGVRSTRAIERLCATDVAFRIACAQDAPDHSTLARFRGDHEAAFVDLFAQVLTLAARAGLGQFGTIAIDGTKIAGNASLDANRGRAWLTAQAAKIVAEADAVDTAEDAAEADRGADGGPPSGWSDPATRQARLAELVSELDRIGTDTVKAQASQQAADRWAADVDAGVLRVGKKPKGADQVRTAHLRLDRAIARAQATLDRWEQRAQATGRRPIGRAPVQVEANYWVLDARRRLTEAERAAAQATSTTTGQGTSTTRPNAATPGPRVNLTDPQSRIQKTRRGWIQGYNAQLAVTADQVIVACQVGQNQADAGAFLPMMTAATNAADHLAQVTDRDTTIGTVLADAGYASHTNLTAPGPDRLIALGKARQTYATAKTAPASGPPDPTAAPRTQMAHRLATPEGAALYKRRGATVEPGIGNLKKILPRFSRRGLTAATAELNLAAAAFNLLKIHRHAPA
jgi:transposase